MRLFITIILCFALNLVAPAQMLQSITDNVAVSAPTGITFVAGGVAQCTSALTCSVSYTPHTVGNKLVGCIGINGAVTSFTSFKDNATTPNTLTAGSNPLITIPAAQVYFYTIPSGTITSYTAIWVSAHASTIAVAEYSGSATAVNGSPTNPTGSGTSAAPSVSPTASETADMAIGCLSISSAGNVQTATSGTIREQGNTTAPGLALIEKLSTGATGTTLSTTASTSATWNATTVMLRP